MPLSAGTKLTHYEILEPIGAGGMGEVYKATDTRLGRVVAIKVLSPELSGESRLRQRFEREARTISSLNHPHLCALFDIGAEDGVDFMVMEYLEGDTLAARLSRGALPLSEALRYAAEIAGALHAAHEAGVVHRDLKPSNVVITSAGAKLLDFGLAKPAGIEEEKGAAASAHPTKAKPLTEEGAILGTFQYMAPEQLEGKDADARTDLFAFGAIVYQMVTGKLAFSGKSKASLIAAIMNAEPPRLSEVEPISPPLLDRVVERCLAKDPRKRWQSALDLREALDWIGSGRALTGSVSSDTRRSPRRVLIAMAIAAGALATGFWLGSGTDPERPVARFPFGVSIAGDAFPRVALSPDGRHVAFIREESLYVRALDEIEPRMLVQVAADEQFSAGARRTSPVFSPDGQWIAYWSSDDTLRKVSMTGSAPVTLCETPFARGLSWDVPERILFTADSVGILEVAASGGTPNVIVPIGGGHVAAEIQLLGQETLLFTRAWSETGWDEAQAVLYSLSTGEERILVDPGAGARVLDGRYIIFARGTALFAARFDTSRLELISEAVPVIPSIRSEARDLPMYSVSRGGSLIYVSGQRFPESELVWVDRSGRVTTAVDGAARYIFQPRLSPDGERLAISIASPEGGFDIWIHDLERKTRTRLTHDESSHRPVWSPDGARIAFTSNHDHSRDIYSVSADGTGAPEPLLARDGAQYLDDWSPDGTFLTFQEPGSGNVSARNIWKLPVEGSPEPVEITAFHERMGRVSPQRNWMAYLSDESGRNEIYVRELVEGGRKMIVSTSGGSSPVWSRDGSELFFLSAGKMMVVDVRYQPLSVSSPRVLLELGPAIVTDAQLSTFDVTPDGEQFLMLQELPRDEAAFVQAQPIVVLNWVEELERLVPSAN